VAHPRASFEVAAVCSALAPLHGARIRTAAACLLAITHLGLLGERRSIGLANALSLLRAGLPVRRWAVLAAVGTDLVDGLVARRAGPTAFGSYADPLADLAFWTAVAFQGRIGQAERTAILGLWAAPAAMIAAGYLVAGRTIDYPRPAMVRTASAIAQVVLAVRSIERMDGAAPAPAAGGRRASPRRRRPAPLRA